MCPIFWLVLYILCICTGLYAVQCRKNIDHCKKITFFFFSLKKESLYNGIHIKPAQFVSKWVNLGTMFGMLMLHLTLMWDVLETDGTYIEKRVCPWVQGEELGNRKCVSSAFMLNSGWALSSSWYQGDISVHYFYWKCSHTMDKCHLMSKFCQCQVLTLTSQPMCEILNS